MFGHLYVNFWGAIYVFVYIVHSIASEPKMFIG